MEQIVWACFPRIRSEEKTIFDLTNPLVIEIDLHLLDDFDSVNVSIEAKSEENAVVLLVYQERKLFINVFEYVCVEDVEIPGKCSRGYYSIDHCYEHLGKNDSSFISLSFNNGVRHVQGWGNGYPAYAFMIDIGSSLGLYFGLTFLTLFEVVVFFFYGTEIELQSFFNNGVRHVQGWGNGYPAYAFMIDIGSSLGLYFGLTFLTLFEVVVFFFYGTEIELQSLSPAPIKTVIYDLPNKKLLERKTKDARRKIQVQSQKMKIAAMNLPPIF
uniref:Uncharacterized protein n=1 Tax=Panagrolaimus sp. JU765 TaxID=591449 RepID=A0AC34QR53_9BILA